MSTDAADDTARRWQSVFSAAAEHFDDEPLSFFARFGAELVDRCELQPGMRVLDVACGTGHAALLAADTVGPTGSVIGVDLAVPLLDVAREKARVRRLTNVEFVAADFRTLDHPDGAFDAVVCSFGIFLVPDMPGGVRELWRMVAPGGRLGVSSWGPDLFEPVGGIWWNAVVAELPPAGLPSGPSPRARLESSAALTSLFVDAGVDGPLAVEYVAGTHRLRSPDDWWTIVMGSGLRGVLDPLDPAATERVRVACVDEITAGAVRDLTTDVLYAVATRHP